MAAGYDLLREELRANKIARTLPAGKIITSRPCGFERNNKLLFNVFPLFDNKYNNNNNNNNNNNKTYNFGKKFALAEKLIGL